jgi:hypothetical protein
MYIEVMPTKTLYIKESDLPLFEQVQEQFGDSVSSMFTEFLRERIGSLKPGEDRVFAVLDQIGAKRQALRTEDQLPTFLDSIYGEAEAQAQNALKRLKARKVRDAKIALSAAILYQELAERTVKQVKEIRDKLQQASITG